MDFNGLFFVYSDARCFLTELNIKTVHCHQTSQCEIMTNITRRHTWTRRNKHLRPRLHPPTASCSAAMCEPTDLLSSIWSGFDLLRHLEVGGYNLCVSEPQGEVITPTSQHEHWADVVRPPHRFITCTVTDKIWMNYGVQIFVCHMWWESFHMIIKFKKRDRIQKFILR